MASPQELAAERWLFTAETLMETPFVTANSSPTARAWEEETALRKNGIYHLMNVGKFLKIPVITTAVGAVYLQRFYQGQSIKQFEPVAMARCCLVLAVKCEDRARDKKKRHRATMKEVIEASHWLEIGGAKNMGKSVEEAVGTRLRNQLLDNECVLLPALGFDFAVEVPQQYIAYAIGEKDVFTRAWKVANHLMASSLPLMYSARLLACGLIKEAANHKKVALRNTKDGQPWFEAFRSASCKFGALEVSKVTEAVQKWTRLPHGRRPPTNAPLSADHAKRKRIPSSGGGSKPSKHPRTPPKPI